MQLSPASHVPLPQTGPPPHQSPHNEGTCAAHEASQVTEQQNGNAAHTAVTHGSQLGDSAPPATHGSCAQPHDPQSDGQKEQSSSKSQSPLPQNEQLPQSPGQVWQSSSKSQTKSPQPPQQSETHVAQLSPGSQKALPQIAQTPQSKEQLWQVSPGAQNESPQRPPLALELATDELELCGP